MKKEFNIPKVLYLCDGNIDKCNKRFCYKSGDGLCKHTSDITHAVNFKKAMVGDKTYFERDPEEDL